MIFGYWVKDLECYGVVEYDCDGWVIDLYEKFVNLLLFYVVFGFYFYDECVVEMVKSFEFLVCGEFEIIDLNCKYLEFGEFGVEFFGCGIVWFDIGIYELLL